MATTQKKTTTPRAPQPDHTLRVLAWIGGGLVLLLSYRLVAATGLNLFTWGDRTFGELEKPVILWAFAGVLPGALAGAFVVAKKYQLAHSWKAVPLSALLVLLLSIGLITPSMTVFQPLLSSADLKTDTPRYVTGQEPKIRSRHHKKTITEAVPDTLTRPAGPAPEDGQNILTEQAEITVHARTDSLLLHYRLQMQHGGNWSDWQDKSVPSAGQSLLTNGEVLKAHAVEWWYEVNGAATRSPGSPFRDDYCDGALVINTY